MSRYQDEMNHLNGGGLLDELKKKKMAKMRPTFIVKLKQGEIKEREKSLVVPSYLEESEVDVEVEEGEIREDENVPSQKKTAIKFVDKRRSFFVDRNLILDRINKHTNLRVIENKKVTGKDSGNEEFRIPSMDGKMGVSASEEQGEQRKTGPRKLNSTITIQEKIGEELEKGVDGFDEELPEVLDEVDNDNEKVGEEKEPEIIVFKPKRVKKKTTEMKEADEEKEDDAGEEVKGKKRTTKKLYEEYRIGEEAIGNDVKIGKKAVVARLPKREKLIVRTSNYYMNNRKLYISKIAELFRPYKKEILENSGKASCESTGKIDFKLLTHQKIVRDYLNLYTPYRGLLLYHGLGSGKTCTSIAIAEGMKTQRQVVLMTPASLKMNFFSQLKECGDVMYRKNQYWEFISTVGNPEYVTILSNVLQLQSDMVQKKKGAWLVDITKKEANFNDLTSEQQKSIDEQLDLMIRAKYLDINYNGLNKNKVNELTDNNTKNPFDNTTVIIDEAHNFVSRIVNKIKTPESISYILYDYLMKATNCKIVLLTGTPMINYPNELGILFNILRGYIKKWTFQLRIKSSAPSSFKLNKEELLKMFDREHFHTYDYVEYSGNKLSITRNPYGFVNTNKRSSEKRGGSSSESFLKEGFLSIFGGKTKKNVDKQDGNQMKKTETETSKNKTKKRKTNKPVKSRFIIENGMVKELKNDEAEEVIPEEETTEYNQRIFPDIHKGGGVFEEYNGVTLDESGNLSDEDFVREVKRIIEKNYLEIVELGSDYEELKALPDDADSFNSLFVDQDEVKMKNENAFKKRILGLTSYFKSAEEKLLPSFVKTESGENYHIVPVDMSEYQFNYYSRVRKEEADEEKRKRQTKQKAAKKGEDLFKVTSTYRIFSRAACNFAFPDPPGRPMPDKGKREMEGVDAGEIDESAIDGISVEELPEMNEYITEEDVESLKQSQKEPVDYQSRIKAALNSIKYDPSKNEDEQYLTEDRLAMYSPKFVKVLENVKSEENTGLHLLYSQFRTIEGVGILKLVLQANGFAEFKIRKKESSDVWEIVENEGDEGKPKFVLYTGTETPEEKEIIRNIYNSVWEVVPVSITHKLKEISSNNHYGEIIKLLMITASGAEGINLRNTRFVHIVEPYWHMVRIEQVIGRARRICSHQNLPEELRTVKVFLYLSVFSEEQKTNKKNIEMMNRDTSRIDDRPITTDESLFDTAIMKSKINTQLLNAIKSTAIDCSLYNPLNKEENLVCYGFGKVETNAFSSYPTLDQDLGEVEETNAKKARILLKETKPIEGVIYAINPKTLELYDLDSYRESLAGTGELLLVGKAVKIGRGQFRIDKV